MIKCHLIEQREGERERTCVSGGGRKEQLSVTVPSETPVAVVPDCIKRLLLLSSISPAWPQAREELYFCARVCVCVCVCVGERQREGVMHTHSFLQCRPYCVWRLQSDMTTGVSRAAFHMAL